MYKKTQGFKKSERIKKRALFNDLFREGRYFKGSDFSLRVLPNKLNIVRLGINIQKAVFPKAIQRSRVKRLIREVFRRNKAILTGGHDILIRPKRFAVANLGYKEAEERLLDLFKIAGLLKQG